LKGLFTVLCRDVSLGFGVVVEVVQLLEPCALRANTRASSAAADANFACASRKATVSDTSNSGATSCEWVEGLISAEPLDVGPNERIK